MPNFRSRKLLDLCRGQPCYIQFDGCEGFNTVPCHSNLQRHGRGTGLKSHDNFTVPGCPKCHYELDYGKNLTRQEKDDAFMRAYEQWQRDLWDGGLVKVA